MDSRPILGDSGFYVEAILWAVIGSMCFAFTNNDRSSYAQGARELVWSPTVDDMNPA